MEQSQQAADGHVGEPFPNYVNSGSGSSSAGTTTPQQQGNLPDEAFGRPASLSLQSVASTEYSTYSDRDALFDSRRSSTISSVSSYPSHRDSLYSVASTDDTPRRTRKDAKQLHASRVQRSGSHSLSIGAGKKPGTLPDAARSRFQRSVSASPAAALAATEPPHEQGLNKMDFSWVTVQQKTFTKWLNTKLDARPNDERDMVVVDLVHDLSDGVLLIHLLEILSQESLGRYASRPKMRVQKFENCQTALNFIKSRGIQLTNIGSEDIVGGNQKLILGLIWTLILRFTISDINEEGMTAKEGLLLWCQRKTACYDEVDVRDFSTSWSDGLAFCALLDIHRPDLIDYDALDKTDRRGNMQLAFDIAHREIGIPKLLDVEDVCDVAKPDERSLMTYIAYWFHAFSQMEKVENAGRRVEKFVNNMQGAWEMQSAYERRMAALLAAVRERVDAWAQATFEGSYADAKAQATEFAAYKRGKKREWVAEKSELATLLGNIKTKLSTYRLRPYAPPAELRLDVMDAEWSRLSQAEMKRGQLINETIRE